MIIQNHFNQGVKRACARFIHSIIYAPRICVIEQRDAAAFAWAVCSLIPRPKCRAPPVGLLNKARARRCGIIGAGLELLIFVYLSVFVFVSVCICLYKFFSGCVVGILCINI